MEGSKVNHLVARKDFSYRSSQTRLLCHHQYRGRHSSEALTVRVAREASASLLSFGGLGLGQKSAPLLLSFTSRS